MKIAALACNIVFFVFTCLVLATDGPPQGAPYVALTLLALLVPLLSSLVFLRCFRAAILWFAALAGNIALLGFSLWAIASQFHHPKEEGVVAYAVLMVLAPLLAMAALLRHGRGGTTAKG